MQTRTAAHVALLCSVLVAGCAGPGHSPRPASAEAKPGVDPAATSLAAEALATVEVALSHCPQIRADAKVLESLVHASGRSQDALRDEEAFLGQMLKLNPLIESYDHATSCRMLSRSFDTRAPGLLLIE
jgi:hypothetical protein